MVSLDHDSPLVKESRGFVEFGGTSGSFDEILKEPLGEVARNVETSSEIDSASRLIRPRRRHRRAASWTVRIGPRDRVNSVARVLRGGGSINRVNREAINPACRSRSVVDLAQVSRPPAEDSISVVRPERGIPEISCSRLRRNQMKFTFFVS